MRGSDVETLLKICASKENKPNPITFKFDTALPSCYRVSALALQKVDVLQCL